MLEEKIEKNFMGKVGGALKRNLGIYLLAGGLALGYAECRTISPDGKQYQMFGSDEWKNCPCQKDSDCPKSGKCGRCFCKECNDDSHCNNLKPYCNSRGDCVECEDDWDCHGIFGPERCEFGECVGSCISDSECTSYCPGKKASCDRYGGGCRCDSE